ncbi:MAG: glycosyltransferase family A protein [Xanthobacteraceae bacterium]|nr:glycosyltransferase family A protein [Xanthobacteraceae bacterium]
MPSCPVSVVIPVRNGAAFIGEAIDSVRAQTMVPRQVIVVDDGSTDATAAVVAGFPGVDYLAQPPLGVSAARNAGAGRASETFLAFLDADDLWLPDKIAAQLDLLASESGPDIASCRMRNFRRTGEGEIVYLTPPTVVSLPGALLMRRDTFQRIGPFAADLTHGENLEWFSRAIDLGLRTLAAPRVLMLRRIHGANTSFDAEGSTRKYLKALQTITARRRDQGGG